LQWLAFSVKKVPLLAAVDVLATDPDAKNGPLFDPDRRFDDPRDVLILCSSLVTITDLDQTDDYPEYFKDDQGKFTELTLAHFSVREYLVSGSLRTHWELSFYHCDTKLANTFIAMTCVAYLLQFTQPSISQDIRISYPLCSYAAEYWIRHTQPDNDDDRILRRLIMSLLQPDSPVYLNWLELYNPEGGAEKCAPIYYMSKAGLAVSEDLLENGADIHVEGGLYDNALQAATSEGHHDIVQLLLEKGADVNAQGHLYGNALQVASSGGHHDIVQLLLEKGADVNAQSGLDGNALQTALFWGHYDIVQLLLEKGADVNAQGHGSGNALQVASEGGHHDIVQLLLEKGADVNAQGGLYGNALQAASLRGHHDIVLLLLEKGVDVNAQGGQYGNALQAASEGDQHDIVQLLLEKGADVNVQGRGEMM
jgi:ankyrin repeat protein